MMISSPVRFILLPLARLLASDFRFGFHFVAEPLNQLFVMLDISHIRVMTGQRVKDDQRLAGREPDLPAQTHAVTVQHYLTLTGNAAVTA